MVAHVTPKLLQDNERVIKMFEYYRDWTERINVRMARLEERMGDPKCPTCGRKN